MDPCAQRPGRQVGLSGAGRAHVDLGAEPQARRPAGVVEIEHDPLALAEHAEHRALEGVGGEVVVGEIGVAHETPSRYRGRRP